MDPQAVAANPSPYLSRSAGIPMMTLCWLVRSAPKPGSSSPGITLC
jgi:hypothetical protein